MKIRNLMPNFRVGMTGFRLPLLCDQLAATCLAAASTLGAQPSFSPDWLFTQGDPKPDENIIEVEADIGGRKVLDRCVWKLNSKDAK